MTDITECRMITVDDLPDEMLLKVFVLLSVPDVATSVANVCVRWHRLAQDPILWNNLQLILDQTHDFEFFMSLLPHLSELKNIWLQWRSEIPQIIEGLSVHCPKLERLVLTACGYFDESCITNLMCYRETLTVFDIGKSWLVSNECIDGVKFFQNLVNLNLSHSTVTCEQLKTISESCTKIVCLNIDYVRGIPEEDILMFIKPREGTLKSLTVFGELLTDNFFKHIEKCSVLNSLYISRSKNFSNVCLASINKLSTLRFLTLKRAIKFTPRAMWMFYFESRVVKNLKYLYISAKRIVTEEDVMFWPQDDFLFFDQSLVNHLCTCLLTKKGFATID